MVDWFLNRQEPSLNISAYTDDDRRIAHIGGVTCFTAWQCLQASLAARFECEPDEIGILEDDDGVERLSLRGAVIGYVTTEIGGITFGIPDAPSIVPEHTPSLVPETVSVPAIDA